MTIRIKSSFGPEGLLTAPRRSGAYPSPDGTRLLYTESTYSFESHSRSTEIKTYRFSDEQQTVISRDVKASEPRWLGDGTQLVWLKDGDNGNTSFIIGSDDKSGKAYCAGTVPGPVSNLKIHVIEPGLVAVAVAARQNADGSLNNPKDNPKSYTTAKLYDATFVRHWDSYVTKERNTIFTALLRKAPASVQGKQGRYHLIGFTNALKGTDLECPIPPFGGTDHFDIGRNGLVIVAKDPNLNPATHTKCNAYWIAKDDLMDLSEPQPIKIEIPGLNGAATSPVIYPGKASDEFSTFAFLQMRTDGYESDQNLIAQVRLKTSTATGESNQPYDFRVLDSHAMNQPDPENKFWTLSPGSLTWAGYSNYLIAEAEYHGAGCLFALLINHDSPGEVRQLTEKHYVTQVSPLADSSFIVLSSNSLVTSSMYSLLDLSRTSQPDLYDLPENQILKSCSVMHTQFGLSPDQVGSIWWKGDNDHPVHALMVVPSTFDSKKKYPLAYFVHGGPQGAWNDQWSTRWNPAVFAEQGYVVIAPNPTGSTGYGQAFTDAIKQNWGGSPYIDLEKGINYIEEHLSYIDKDHMVALGASYGGYMMNWFQSHPLGRKFKALVCHDGVFSMTGQLASEEQYFPIHDMGGTIWEKPEYYTKWDPAAPERLAKWNTPMLVIHNDLDFRLTVAEGLSAFNVLQTKGIESRFLTFSDEGHWVLNPENSLIWHLVVINWCNKFAGLPEVRDSQGRNGDEFCKQGRRKAPSDK